jgi:hypothetical protein
LYQCVHQLLIIKWSQARLRPTAARLAGCLACEFMILEALILGLLLVGAAAVLVAGAVLGTNQRRWEELNRE